MTSLLYRRRPDFVKHGSKLNSLFNYFFKKPHDKGVACTCYGLLSGYPICCVRFYRDVWHPMSSDEKFKISRYWRSVGYVQCPQCRGMIEPTD